MEVIRITTDRAETGMVVASDVITSNNQLVLTKGTTLDDRMITRLRFYGIYDFYIYKSKPVGESKIEDSYIEKLRSSEDFKKFNHNYVESVDKVKDRLVNVLSEDEELNIDELLADTERILREARNGAHVMEMLHGIRDYDDMTYVHSLNVSLLCNVFAGWLKFSPEETKSLTLAGLLHDIGKMLVPKEIITKEGKLTDEEYEIVKTHTTKGYQALKKYPLDIRIKSAVLMHHERCDGSGYPNGFRGDTIDEFSKIIAIADVYDAMTSKRRYRSAFCPFEVVENFERDGLQKFDPKYLMLFLERVVQSYLHNTVKLSDGREGEVVMINKFCLSKPVVRIGSLFVDLSKETWIKIVSIV